MPSYNDWEAATDKPEFYLKAIVEYQASEPYNRALLAQDYYARNNRTIINRMNFMERFKIPGSKIKFFKVRSGFFPKAVKQLSQYLLGNGVTLDEEDKDLLGKTFDKDLQRMGIQTLVDGVNWGFWNVDRLMVYRATEFLPLFDEFTGDMRIGVRFLFIGEDKILNVEVYAEDGISKYHMDANSGRLIEDTDRPIPYKQSVRKDILGASVIDFENYPTIPVFPLYANDLHASEFTDGLREDIDAYDYISSDLVDGVVTEDGLYWVIKNFEGSNPSEIPSMVQQLKTVMLTDSTSAEGKVIETPYNAKKAALEMLEKRMYKETQTLNTEELTGGSLTNVAIKVAMTDFDLKADIFEWQVSDFVQRILDLIGVEDAEPKFKRRTLTNDTETVQNIYTMREDIDQQTALELNPLIPDDMVEDILDRIAEEELGADEEDEDLEEDIQLEEADTSEIDAELAELDALEAEI